MCHCNISVDIIGCGHLYAVYVHLVREIIYMELRWTLAPHKCLYFVLSMCVFVFLLWLLLFVLFLFVVYSKS